MIADRQAAYSRNWRLYALAFTPGILIYLYRAWFIFYELPVMCLFSIVCFIVIVAVLIDVLLSKTGPAIAWCLFGIVIGLGIPRLYPEQIHLILHHSEYETVVELVRNHQLGHTDICQFAYVLPDKYANLSDRKEKCIFVEYEPALVVEFEPLFPRQLLVYAETPEAVKQYISCGGSDGEGYCHLEGNWYVCFQDWN